MATFDFYGFSICTDLDLERVIDFLVLESTRQGRLTVLKWSAYQHGPISGQLGDLETGSFVRSQIDDFGATEDFGSKLSFETFVHTYGGSVYGGKPLQMTSSLPYNSF